MTATIHLGDCREIIATLPDCSIDSIVTDPPYELGFMGKRWDASGIAYDVTLWTECLRVLKPGGHLLAFGGTRTYHRMAVAIEDAGFEIRDSIHWIYGSGFPKSLDVSKAIDKKRYDRADIYKVTAWVKAARDAAGIGNKDIDDAFGFAGMSGHWTSTKSQPAVPTLEQVPTLLEVLGVKVENVPDDIRRLLWDLNGKKGQPGENWAKREVVGVKKSSLGGTVAAGERDPEFINKHKGLEFDITAPATDAARQWEGWGTALKPAHEPIVMARKPLAGTVADNVLEHGTGALNIDGARIQYESESDKQKMAAGVEAIRKRGGVMQNSWKNSSDLSGANPASENGRWPANIVITHAADCGDSCAADCPVAELDRQSGNRPGGQYPARRGKAVATGFAGGQVTEGGARSMGDSGGASRFFTVTEWDDVTPFLYVAKPSRSERNAGLDALKPKIGAAKGNGLSRPCASCGSSVIEGCDCPDRTFVNPALKNHHPTVKPLALMRHLVRLVTPPGGTVLEPFAGSGTTLAAAILEGFNAIGCELTDDYLPIIEGRIAWAQQQTELDQESLFNQ